MAGRPEPVNAYRITDHWVLVAAEGLHWEDVMKLSRFEKIVYVGCPWLFGVVFILVGLLAEFAHPFTKMLCTGFGLLFISLYCICALLAKIAEKDTRESVS